MDRGLYIAMSGAKQTLLANGGSYYEQVSETFLLFGDPAMELQVPLPRRPAGEDVDQVVVTLFKSPRSVTGVRRTWALVQPVSSEITISAEQPALDEPHAQHLDNRPDDPARVEPGRRQPLGRRPGRRPD